MKRILLIFTVIVTLLFSAISPVSAARFDFGKDDFAFLQKYNDASRHAGTAVKQFKWQKTNVLGDNYHLIGKGVAIHVNEDEITGDIVTIGVSFDFGKGKPFTEQAAFNELVVPAFYRVLRMFADVPASDVQNILDAINIKSIEEHGEPDIAGLGSFSTGAPYEDLLVVTILYPKQRSVAIFVAYQKDR